jgi:release factor glutamine methyltransferase
MATHILFHCFLLILPCPPIAASRHMSSHATLPSLDHLNFKDYDNVYEPSDDTFLLCDALKTECSVGGETLLRTRGLVCAEMGSGSGCVITCFGQLLVEFAGNPGCVLFAIDINPLAAQITKRTAAANNVVIDAIHGNLFSSLRMFSSSPPPLLDVLIFNPPYVPTPDEEVGGNGIEASWAGGTYGRVVIDRFLPYLPRVLATTGICYLLLVEENKPREIIDIVSSMGFVNSRIIQTRRARNELLHILKIQR